MAISENASLKHFPLPTWRLPPGMNSLESFYFLCCLFNSIQFNSVYLYSPISQITNLSRSGLQSVHIDIPAPKPHIGPGKTPK